MKLKYMLKILLLLFCVNVNAGEWFYAKNIVRIEARGGDSVSIILSDTIPHNGSAQLCPVNRVWFQRDKWIDQNGVNHHYSIVLSASATNKNISVHVEVENGICFGRITFVDQ